MASNSALDQANALAADMLDQTRLALMTTYRFMDVALWRMPSKRRNLTCALASDGTYLYYDSLAVIERYRESPAELARDYLHVILHCVFRHQFDEKHPQADMWDLASDIAVESACMELAALKFPSERDQERQRAIDKLSKSCGELVAQRLYRFACDALGASGEQSRQPTMAGLEHEAISDLFARDDHAVWARQEPRRDADLAFTKEGKLIAGDDGQKIKGGEDQEIPDDEPSKKAGINSPGAPAPSTGGPAAEGEVENPDRLVALDSDEEAEATFESMDGVEVGDFEGISWRDISKQIQMDMEAFTGKIGSTAGTFLVNLSVANRKTYDYRDFLKRFSARSEELKVSTEEFDYVYYTYGLRMYKNMPLVEPLEYQESNRVKDFVIAIDTSASCGGALVKKFVEKTYDVLKSESGFGRKVNVHVIQCDSDIRKDIKITQMNDIDESFMDFQIRGFGGTDFRPVFKYVDELVAKRELLNLKGLIYLTDGLGKFPERPPDYDAAFVFVDDGQRERKVPPWAMKVIMDEDEIVEL